MREAIIAYSEKIGGMWFIHGKMGTVRYLWYTRKEAEKKYRADYRRKLERKE